MLKFFDANQNEVHLDFKKNAFSITPGHVLVICRYKNYWLLTKHAERGLEFPGGKVEKGESVEEAGVREVLEETGGIAIIRDYLGEYHVYDKNKPFVKAIVFAEIGHLEQRDSYFETNGPALVEGDLILRLQDDEFSFIMKDEVVKAALCKAKEKSLY